MNINMLINNTHIIIGNRYYYNYSYYTSHKALKTNNMSELKKSISKKVKNLPVHTEKSVEKKLIKIVQAKNGACIKLQGGKSLPDRLCLWPAGNVWFVELKKPGKKPDPLQLAMHAALRKLGFKVSVIWNDEQLKQFEREISAV